MGKVRYMVRDFPLESIHPQAFQAAEAARCAGEQGRYWEMHAALFQNQRALHPDDLRRHAQEIGPDAAAFDACVDGGRYADAVRADMADGRAAGVSGTPTFFLAVAGEEPGTLRALRKLRGAHPFGAFRGAIDAALAELAAGGGAPGDDGTN